MVARRARSGAAPAPAHALGFESLRGARRAPRAARQKPVGRTARSARAADGWRSPACHSPHLLCPPKASGRAWPPNVRWVQQQSRRASSATGVCAHRAVPRRCSRAAARQRMCGRSCRRRQVRACHRASSRSSQFRRSRAVDKDQDVLSRERLAVRLRCGYGSRWTHWLRPIWVPKGWLVTTVERDGHIWQCRVVLERLKQHPCKDRRAA